MLAHIERAASLTAPLAAGYSRLIPSEPEFPPTVSMTPCQHSDLCVVAYEFWGLNKERASYQSFRPLVIFSKLSFL